MSTSNQRLCTMGFKCKYKSSKWSLSKFYYPKQKMFVNIVAKLCTLKFIRDFQNICNILRKVLNISLIDVEIEDRFGAKVVLTLHLRELP